MTEQFRVQFTGDNKLSAVLARVSRELESVYTRAGTAVSAINNLNTTMASSRSGTLSTDVKEIGAALKSIQGVSLSRIIGQFATFERRTLAVNRNLQAIEATLTRIGSMPAVTPAITIPPTPSGGGGGGGGGTFTPTAYQTFERTLHVFNSLTYAVGTVTMAFQQYYDTVRAGNELTRAQTLLMSVVQSEGLLPGITAMQKYAVAVQVATRNQVLFGGSLSESIEGILKLQQISQSAGMSLNTLNDAVQLLSLRDPVQGIEGATIAIQELISGDPMSLRRRFELPADAVNRLANMAGNAQAQIQGLTDLLATQGITLDALNDQLNSTAATYNRLESAASNAYQRLGQQLAQIGEPAAAALSEQLAMLSVGVAPSGALSDISGLYTGILPQMQLYFEALDLINGAMLNNVDIAQYMDDQTRALYEGMVRNGTITSEITLQRLQDEDRAYEYSIGVINRYAAETEAAGARQRAAFAGDFADNYRQKILDMIDAQMKANSSRRAQLHLDAAAELAQTNLAQAVLVYSRALNVTQLEAEELIKLRMVELNLTEDNVRALYGLEVAIEEVKTSYQLLAESMAEANKSTLEQKRVDESLIQLLPNVLDGTLKFAQAQAILAQAFGLSAEQAYNLLAAYMDLSTFDPDEISQQIRGTYIPGTVDYFGRGASRIYGQAYREAMRAYNPRDALGVIGDGLNKIQEETDKAGKKRLSTIENNTKRMLDIEADAYMRLLEHDKSMHRKRIEELQSYYASALLMTQKRQYEITANNLDLIEGRNSKLSNEDRQRLLARENIEAYGTLQLNEATKKANQIALNGNASFAKEYLSIQEERIAETENINWKLHDTLVRLEGDPAAQDRARTVHAQSITDLETYYGTRVSLAEAAAEAEREAEREARKAIIEDAISSVMAFEDVDEGKRQAIIDGLNVAKTTIADLSSVYVSGVDAMRGSLELLAKAMKDVKDNASILTPEQLAMFNKLPSGISGGNVGPNGTINIEDSQNTTTVNVGGITVQVTSQADPQAIADTVLRILQEQQNQRGG